MGISCLRWGPLYLTLLGYAAGLRHPEYCSPIEHVKGRVIPPASQLHTDKYELVRVSAIIRHGSRSPSELTHCWPSYTPTSHWGCDASEFITTPTAHSHPLFAKYSYEEGDRGVCEFGQLLPHGFEQMKANGRVLQRAYMGNSSVVAELFHDDEIITPTDLILRSSDIQRTLMSGQELVKSFFEGKFEEGARFHWFAPEMSTDYLFANTPYCPVLRTMWDQIYHTEEFIAWNTSDEVQHTVNEFTRQVGGFYPWYDLEGAALDCMMCNLCSGEGLPHTVKHSTLEAAMDVVEAREAFRLTYEDSIWSKIAMVESNIARLCG